MSATPKDVALRALSGTDTSGLSMVDITAVGSSGANTIHTGVSGTSDADFVTLYAVNYSGSSNYTLTLMVGSEEIGPIQINRNQAPVQVLSRFRMNNSTVLAGYANSASQIRVFGHVHRVTEAGS